MSYKKMLVFKKNLLAKNLKTMLPELQPFGIETFWNCVILELPHFVAYLTQMCYSVKVDNTNSHLQKTMNKLQITKMMLFPTCYSL